MVFIPIAISVLKNNVRLQTINDIINSEIGVNYNYCSTQKTFIMVMGQLSYFEFVRDIKRFIKSDHLY